MGAREGPCAHCRRWATSPTLRVDGIPIMELLCVSCAFQEARRLLVSVHAGRLSLCEPAPFGRLSIADESGGLSLRDKGAPTDLK